MKPILKVQTNLHISVKSFSYPGWENDKKSIEKTMSRSPSSLAENNAKRKLKAMENKQHLHDGIGLHPGIRKVQVPGAFTYPEIAKDLKEVFKQYMLGNDVLVDRLLCQIDFKQKLYDGDRSDPFLVKLDGHTFTYPAWKQDKCKIEDTLANSLRSCVHHDVRRMLKGMENKQRFFEKKDCNRGLTFLHSEVFSYWNFQRDKLVALDFYEKGDDAAFEQMIQRIKFKQSLQDGDRSHPLLAALDSAQFDYPGWKEDLNMVENTLVHSVSSFAEFDARRLFKGIENKQRLYSGVNVHPGVAILKSGQFSYKGFKRDMESALNEYCAGYNSAFEKRLERIQQKQKLHNGDRSSPVLATLDRAAACSPRSVTDVSRVSQSQEKPERTRTRDVERFVPDNCVICLEAPRTHIFTPCGHLTLCNLCAFKPPYNRRRVTMKHKCPICRKKSTSIQKVYF